MLPLLYVIFRRLNVDFILTRILSHSIFFTFLSATLYLREPASERRLYSHVFSIFGQNKQGPA